MVINMMNLSYFKVKIEGKTEHTKGKSLWAERDLDSGTRGRLCSCSRSVRDGGWPRSGGLRPYIYFLVILLSDSSRRWLFCMWPRLHWALSVSYTTRLIPTPGSIQASQRPHTQSYRCLAPWQLSLQILICLIKFSFVSFVSLTSQVKLIFFVSPPLTCEIKRKTRKSITQMTVKYSNEY